MKKFFKKTEGFTLVELIVVIAILGIIAGVGTVGYSGYIKKANMAADNQLLGVINHAFAAACMENGVDAKSLADGSVDVTLTAGKVTAISKYSEDFAKYYAGNQDSVFKVIARLVFENGVFVGMDPSGKTLTASQQAALNKFKESNMSGDGKEVAIAHSANSVSNLFAEYYLSGSDPLGAMEGLLAGDFESFKTTYKLDEDSTSTEIANAAVLYVASKASNMKADEILETIEANGSNAFMAVADKYGALPTAAMMYGVVTGYANSDYASDTFKTAYEDKPTELDDVTSLFNQMLTETQSNDYLTSETKGVVADMDGYLGALQLVGNYKDSFDISDENAFDNEEVLALLSTILTN